MVNDNTQMVCFERVTTQCRTSVVEEYDLREEKLKVNLMLDKIMSFDRSMWCIKAT